MLPVSKVENISTVISYEDKDLVDTEVIDQFSGVSPYEEEDQGIGVKRKNKDVTFHVCFVCQKSFVSPYYLERHLRVHTGQKPYTCEMCGRSFSQPNNLKRHEKLHLKDAI